MPVTCSGRRSKPTAITRSCVQCVRVVQLVWAAGHRCVVRTQRQPHITAAFLTGHNDGQRSSRLSLCRTAHQNL